MIFGGLVRRAEEHDRLVGLLAWGVTLGNNDVGLGVLQPAVTGTWVVTPEMLRGDQPIMFLGPSYEPAKDH